MIKFAYQLKEQSDRPPDGWIELSRPTGNRREDELFARMLLRKKLNVGRLPNGTVLWKDDGP